MFFVLFAVLSCALALLSGVFAIVVGERAAEAVLLVMGAGMLMAAPLSWYLAHARAGV